MLRLWCISVVCTVKKTSLSEMKLFVHVSIIMLYIFNLFHVVTVVYDEGSGFYLRTFNIVRSLGCVILLAISC